MTKQGHQYEAITQSHMADVSRSKPDPFKTPSTSGQAISQLSSSIARFITDLDSGSYPRQGSMQMQIGKAQVLGVLAPPVSLIVLYEREFLLQFAASCKTMPELSLASLVIKPSDQTHSICYGSTPPHMTTAF
ncbi:hypothetical protein AcV7_001832 [Taiwanofungus camphoratus]|nr:hypothetical protein AcV7_001832 [Antrodia cinnamomea]